MLSTTGPAFAAVAGVVVVALLVTPVTGRALTQVVTLVHELGHAGVGLLVGGRVRRVSIALDASGETLTLIGGRYPRLRLSAFTLAGYPAPPLIGVIAAASVASEDHRLFLLLGAMLVAFALVLWVRNPWGVVVFAATAVVLWLAATEAPDALTRTVTIALAWLFSLGGLRSAWQLIHGPRARSGSLDDAERAAQLSRVVPRSVVTAFFVVVAAVAVAGVGALLLRPG